MTPTDTANRVWKYGIDVPPRWNDLKGEMYCVQQIEAGTFFGESPGLAHHYREIMKLLWPEDHHHRWSDLILEHYCRQRYIIVLGPRDTGKTYCWSRIALVDYWCFPKETLWLVSSTEMRSLELRVWGAIKDLFNRAREKYAWLAGNINESMHAIFTEKIGENGEARDIRKGLITIPCLGGQGEWAGEALAKFVGIKQKRRRLLGDELSLMKMPYLISVEHSDRAKGNFKFCGAANPNGTINPAEKMGEPKAGWGSEPQSDKTEVWENKWGGITINFDGRDTLNNEEPKNRFSEYMLTQEDIDRTAKRYGTDSGTYWTQVIGKHNSRLEAKRVLTPQMVKRFNAEAPCVWEGTEPTRVYAMDAAFGGDRAVHGMIEFGRDVKGQNVIKVHPPLIAPVQLSLPEVPEEQLARAANTFCKANRIGAEHVFFDAGMRATLVSHMAHSLGDSINAINFGGPATKRPVADDEFVIDKITRQRRLKLCDETYSKFVTELWFTVRLIVTCRQMRELPENVAEEFYMREWHPATGDRYELETKDECKQRLGYSPDFADWLSIACEGARRLGFQIEMLRSETEKRDEDQYWLEKEVREHRRHERKRELSYA